MNDSNGVPQAPAREMAREHVPTQRPLQGAHARLEPLAPAHEADLREAGQSPEIWTYLPVDQPFLTAASSRAWMEEAFAQRDAGRRWPFAVVVAETGRAVGSTSYLDPQWAHKSLEIGWTWLTPAYWRTVINTEAKLLLLQHAFDDLGLYRVQLKTDSRNHRSQRAIERLGARREGVLRSQMLYANGYRRDSVFYSILDAEWPDVRRRLEAALGRPHASAPSDALAPAWLQDGHDVLQRMPAVLSTLLAGLPRVLLEVNEGPGTWSPRQVLQHLLWGEVDDWVPRVRLIQARGAEEPFRPFDREEGFRRYGDWSIDRLLAEFARVRAENLRTVDVRALDAPSLAAEGRHPELGRVTLAELVATWVTHDLTHLAQIARTLTRHAGTQVGPWRAYFSLLHARNIPRPPL